MRIGIRVRPGARRDAVGGRWDGPRGSSLLVAVAAPAVDGRANEAVCRVLAKALGVRRGRLEIVAGQRGRDKVVSVDRPPEGLADRVSELMRGE
ncbi:MAG TPA: DUF167 domain-containing protein [Pseudonocardiaceae bacterium]|jgi:hypothetical protein|nr:DUF167 domain-containing protein [Pseudonocardiaceae bacterium]